MGRLLGCKLTKGLTRWWLRNVDCRHESGWHVRSSMFLLPLGEIWLFKEGRVVNFPLSGLQKENFHFSLGFLPEHCQFEVQIGTIRMPWWAEGIEP